MSQKSCKCAWRYGGNCSPRVEREARIELQARMEFGMVGVGHGPQTQEKKKEDKYPLKNVGHESLPISKSGFVPSSREAGNSTFDEVSGEGKHIWIEKP